MKKLFVIASIALSFAACQSASQQGEKRMIAVGDSVKRKMIAVGDSIQKRMIAVGDSVNKNNRLSQAILAKTAQN